MTVLATLISWIFWAHPLHVSVTEIDFDEKERELEIVSRIFTDDLESGIRTERAMPELDLLHPPNGLTTHQLVKDYVLGKISITLDGKIQKLNFLGFEDDGEALICYIQIKEVRKFKSIVVTNRVLLDTFDDQSNLVHVTVGGKVKSLRLLRGKDSGTLTY